MILSATAAPAARFLSRNAIAPERSTGLSLSPPGRPPKALLLRRQSATSRGRPASWPRVSSRRMRAEGTTSAFTQIQPRRRALAPGISLPLSDQGGPRERVCCRYPRESGGRSRPARRERCACRQNQVAGLPARPAASRAADNVPASDDSERWRRAWRTAASTRRSASRSISRQAPRGPQCCSASPSSTGSGGCQVPAQLRVAGSEQAGRPRGGA